MSSYDTVFHVSSQMQWWEQLLLCSVSGSWYLIALHQLYSFVSQTTTASLFVTLNVSGHRVSLSCWYVLADCDSIESQYLHCFPLAALTPQFKHMLRGFAVKCLLAMGETFVFCHLLPNAKPHSRVIMTSIYKNSANTCFLVLCTPKSKGD